VKLLYGGELLCCEGLRLRIKDIDFAQSQIVVRDVEVWLNLAEWVTAPLGLTIPELD
jgi:hypothetical protein